MTIDTRAALIERIVDAWHDTVIPTSVEALAADVARTRAAGVARDGVDHMAGITDEEMARALGGDSVTLGGGAVRMSAVGAEPPPAPHPLDDLKAYVADADKNFRSDAAVSLYREGLIAGQLDASSKMLALAETAIAAVERERDEARAALETQRLYGNNLILCAESRAEADRAALVCLVKALDAFLNVANEAPRPLNLWRNVAGALICAEARLAGATPLGYAVDGPRPRRFVVDGWTSKDTSEAATLKEAREAADLWRDAFGGTVRPLAEQAEPSQASHRDMGARQREALDKLRKAIHFTTDDRDDGAPSTPAEHALLALQRACETRDWDATNAAAACLCETLADESRALRLAAAAVFGDEFRRKGDLT